MHRDRVIYEVTAGEKMVQTKQTHPAPLIPMPCPGEAQDTPGISLTVRNTEIPRSPLYITDEYF